MTTQIEYALMSGASYISTRAEVNQFPVPIGWLEHVEDRRQIKSSGFEATYFTKGTEIVISYAGTDPGDLSGDIAADLALAAGIISDQLRQAADYYLQVKATNPSATITFAGHSLGGGLAALMAVLFGESAYTFDQAPFLQSAQIFVDTDANGNQTSRSVAQRLRAYLTGRTTDTAALTKLDAFIAANDPLNTSPTNPADTLAVRGGRVTNINVDGEFLTSWPVVPTSNRIGSQADIVNSHDGLGLLGGIDLHAIELLTAFLQSDPIAATNTDPQTESLNRVTYKLPDLLKMIFDEKLFAYDRGTGNKDNEDFLTRIVRHQAGVNGSSSADDMVKRFTSDLWQLAQDGGLTLTDGNPDDSAAHLVSNALIAFAMQKYYEEKNTSVGYQAKLFITDDVTGGLRFDMAAIADKFKEALDGQKPLTLSDAKGYEQYFKQYLASAAFTAEERGQITAFLPEMRDWYVQAGSGGMTATDTQNRGAFMLGGNGGDTLTGGTADDLLVGNAGADTLAGGEGSDILLGGAGVDTLNGDNGKDMLLGGANDDTLNGGQGNDILHGGDGADTYAFTGDYGVDIITDSDGSGSIIVDSQSLGSATQTFDSVYKDEASGQIFVKLNGGQNLVVLKEDSKNRILVTDWPGGGTLGISLQDKAAEVPVATLTDRGGAMLRSAGKNGQKRKSLLKQSCPGRAANDHVFGAQRRAA